MCTVVEVGGARHLPFQHVVDELQRKLSNPLTLVVRGAPSYDPGNAASLATVDH